MKNNGQDMLFHDLRCGLNALKLSVFALPTADTREQRLEFLAYIQQSADEIDEVLQRLNAAGVTAEQVMAEEAGLE